MLDFGKAWLNPSRYRGPDDDQVAQRQTRPLDPNVPSPPSGSDRRLVAQLLQAVTNAATLTQLLPFASGLPTLVGINPGRDQFQAFLDQLNQGITEISQLGGGLVSQPAPPGQPAGNAAGIQRQRSLTASALGCSPHTQVAPGTPLSVRRFDEFASAFSDAMTVEGAVADGLQDGLPPAAVELVQAMITAIRNNLLAGDLASARRAGSDAASMIVAIWQVLNDGEPAQRRQRSEEPEPGSPAARLRRVEGSDQLAHYAAPGYEGACRELVRKGGATITHRRRVGEDDWEETPFAGQAVVSGRVRNIPRR